MSKLWRRFLRCYWHGRGFYALVAGSVVVGVGAAIWLLCQGVPLPHAITSGAAMVAILCFGLRAFTEFAPYVDE